MGDDRISVILVSARNPLNIGAVARAMCNFGFHQLRVVNPYDAGFREARSAVGASSVLANAKVFTSVAEAVADCTLVVGTTAVGHRHLHHPLKTPADGAPLILNELRSPGPQPRQIAILFGSEKVGLSNEDLSHCHWLLHIPTREEQPSMNLAHSVAVCLYELVRQRADSPTLENVLPALAADLDRITTVLLSVLDESGYTAARPSADTEEVVRRMVRRMKISAEDSTVWLGMLRQIAWKLRQQS